MNDVDLLNIILIDSMNVAYYKGKIVYLKLIRF